MQTRSTCTLVLILCTALFTASLQSAAHGGVIGTQEYLSAIDRDATIARIDAVLARDEVRSRLEHLGVDTAAAQARVAALTDSELETLANDLESLPAGGGLLGAIGIAFIVLLILELVGVIDIFKKI